MKDKINKYFLIIIITSLILNIFQYSNYKIKTNNKQKENEVIFNMKLQNTIYNIQSLKTSKYDRVVNVSILGYTLGELCTLCKLTSYNNKNTKILTSLLSLKDTFTNNNRLIQLLDKTDFDELLFCLNKLKNDPLDEKSAENLYNISNKMR